MFDRIGKRKRLEQILKCTYLCTKTTFTTYLNVPISIDSKCLCLIIVRIYIAYLRPVDTPDNDVLFVEVWDFDAAETVKEKVTKVGEIKGFKGLHRFMKEIAVTATNGKHDNEIIGTTIIPLKVIIIILLLLGVILAI